MNTKKTLPPAIIVANETHNNNGFIKIEEVTYLYNKVFKLYMRNDIVKKYRNLRMKKNYSPAKAFSKLMLN